MSVKIRLKRLGKIRAPFYRVVVADERSKRNGRVIEEIGKYQPTLEPSLIEIDSDRAQYWLSVGAQPTEAVLALLKLTGDWGKYKGEGETESQVKPQVAKEEFVADTAKKPVLRPKSEPKAETKAEEAPAEDAAEAATEKNEA
ncbi:MAG: 30S ribosomal protein S16 [Gulosibacter sp.]|uniref:30S ribosomal protein S16 n=1 Tax=Gulosibacter sp. TaxID=2817531 RepID=UPI003F900FF4